MYADVRAGMGAVIGRRIVALLAGVTVTISSWSTQSAQAQAGFAELPADVIGFIGHRAGCQNWSNKTFDPARVTETNNIIRLMKCGDLKDEETALRNEYAGNPRILAALDATWTKIVRRVPVRIPLGS